LQESWELSQIDSFKESGSHGSLESSINKVEAELQNDIEIMNQAIEDHRTDVYIANELIEADPIPADAQVEGVEILQHKIQGYFGVVANTIARGGQKALRTLNKHAVSDQWASG